MHNNFASNPTHTSSAGNISVLASLRALLPERRVLFVEALQLAEVQAVRLLQLRQITEFPVPIEVVTELPRISVHYDPDLPRHAASGSSAWDHRSRSWIISINPDEPETRQRFTILHEYKHIIDHGHAGLGGRLPATIYRLTPLEYLAEYFAGCVLMPKAWIKAAFCSGLQHPAELAEHFHVSERAMEVRLSQLGLSEPNQVAHPTTSHAANAGYRLQPRSHWTRARYHRPLSPHRPLAAAVTEEVAA
jgi:Zn-dependent peptidase ImmA (M78 family)